MGHELPTTHPHYHGLLYAANLWPAENAPGMQGFKRALSTYYRDLEQLSQRMFSLFALSLGLPADYFKEHTMDTPMNSMNCLHYPPLGEDAPPEQMGVCICAGAGCLFTQVVVMHVRSTVAAFVWCSGFALVVVV